MDSTRPKQHGTNHFHIRWSTGKLDWQRLDTEEEAEKLAEELRIGGEAYRVEQHDQSCERCRQYTWLSRAIAGM